MATATKRKTERRRIDDMPEFSRLTAEIDKLSTQRAEIDQERNALPVTVGPAPDAAATAQILLADNRDAYRRSWQLRFKAEALAEDIAKLEAEKRTVQGAEGTKLYEQDYAPEHYEKLKAVVDAGENFRQAIDNEEEFAQLAGRACMIDPPVRAKGCFHACPRLVDLLKSVKFARVRERLATFKQTLKGK